MMFSKTFRTLSVSSKKPLSSTGLRCFSGLDKLQTQNAFSPWRPDAPEYEKDEDSGLLYKVIHDYERRHNHSPGNIFGECSHRIFMNNCNVTHTGPDSWATVFGSDIFPVEQKRYKILYKFKIINNSDYGVIIGITSNNKLKEYHCLGTTDNEDNYGIRTNGYKGHNGIWNSFDGIKCSNGDIVVMDVDLIENRISFYRNDKSIGTAYNNIKSKNKNYRFAISLYNKQGEVRVEKISVFDLNGNSSNWIKDFTSRHFWSIQILMVIVGIGIWTNGEQIPIVVNYAKNYALKIIQK